MSVAQASGHWRPARRSRVIYAVSTTLLLLAGGIWLAREWSDLEHAIVVLQGMSRGAVAWAAAAQAASYLGSGYLLLSGVALVRERIRLRRAIMVTLAANAVGAIGGSVTALALTLRWMLLGGSGEEAASLAATLPFVFNNLVLLALSLFGMVRLLAAHQLSAAQETFFLGAAVGFGLLFVLLRLAAARSAAVLRLAHRSGMAWTAWRRKPYRPERTEAALRPFFDAWDRVRNGGWRGPLLGAIANIGFDLVTLYALFRAVGHPIAIGPLVVGYGLPLLMGKFGPLPGGIGLVEGGMLALYGTFGFPRATLVVVVLAYRLLSFWLPTLAGIALVPYLNREGATAASTVA